MKSPTNRVFRAFNCFVSLKLGQNDPKEGVSAMKTNGMFVVMVLALVAFVGMFVSSASAAGGGMPFDNLSNSINLDDFSFSYNTSTAGDKTNFNANMTNIDRIMSAGVSIWRDNLDPMSGGVGAYFYGIVGEPAVAMNYQSQNMDINRHGVHYSSSVGLSSWQEIIGWTTDGKDGEPIYGDWLSNVWTSVTLFDVEPTQASSYYSEWTDTDSGTTYFNANVSWQLNFATDTPAFQYSATVPEPATMLLLGMGGVAALLRRRKK